jgi:arylsulfatase A-like enzyme
LGEGSIKVPSFIYYKPFIKNRINLEVFHAIDVLPTLCNLSEVCLNVDSDGNNIYSKNKNLRILVHILMGSDSNNFFGCCQKNKIKYIRFGDKVEVYNLQNDPFEIKNIAGQNPTLEKELSRHLQFCFKEYKPDPITWHNPNGYPDGFVFPKHWNQQKKEIKILTEEFNFFDFKSSPVNFLGYYNL